MGKKRGRPLQLKKNPGPDGESATQHAQSLLDDVRESRDVEFAAEKKNSERKKRKKATDAEPFAVGKDGRRIASTKGTTVAALKQRGGLQVWQKAALRRKAAQAKENELGQSIETELDVRNLNRSGIDPKTSTKIMETAKEQRAEILGERTTPVGHAVEKNPALEIALNGVGERLTPKMENGEDSDDDSEEGEQSSPVSSEFDSGAKGADDEGNLDFLDASKITDEEELALAMFSNGIALHHKQDSNHNLAALPNPLEQEGSQRVMLADLIIAKIREKEEANARAAAVAADPRKAERDNKIAEVYGLVGNIMSRYRSGKVPKALKVIPKQRNWEDLLYLTRPDEWTPAAVYIATRILASNLRPKQVVRYYADVLLPRCLEDITENKKLNYHLYRALGKAVYKPEAFCKGILFPLCEDVSSTLRQATIIGSVVAKVSIPMLHSAAALLYICQLPYSPRNSIIITSLIEKKYALPYRVLDCIVDSFLQMRGDPRPLPLMWHQSLLAFSQLYKTELSMEQKESLKRLMRLHTHHAVTPEIRRELFSSRNRGDLMDPDANTVARNIAMAAAVDC